MLDGPGAFRGPDVQQRHVLVPDVSRLSRSEHRVRRRDRALSRTADAARQRPGRAGQRRARDRQLLRRPRRPRADRPHADARRRPDAWRTSGGGAQPQLLDAPVRRRSVGAEPDHVAQRPADDHRRRRAGRLLRHRRRREPRRDGAGDDEGADDADLGRSAEPPQPLAHGDGAAEAGRRRRRRRRRR